MQLIPPDAFDGMWTSLNDQQISPFELVGDVLRMFVYAVHLLVRCATIDGANVERTAQMENLMVMSPVHVLLARAMISGDTGESNANSVIFFSSILFLMNTIDSLAQPM